MNHKPIKCKPLVDLIHENYDFCDSYCPYMEECFDGCAIENEEMLEIYFDDIIGGKDE